MNVQFGEFVKELKKNDIISVPYTLTCLPSHCPLIQEDHYPVFWRHSLVLSVKELEWPMWAISPKLWKSLINYSYLSAELGFMLSFKLNTFLMLDVHWHFVFLYLKCVSYRKCTIGPWTMWVLRVLTPQCSRKSMCNFWFPKSLTMNSLPLTGTYQ